MASVADFAGGLEEVPRTSSRGQFPVLLFPTELIGFIWDYNPNTLKVNPFGVQDFKNT
jgi:hypothetical protein